jgi:hypothetical protein
MGKATGAELRLSESSAYAGSAHSFNVCVSWVRPEVSARCAELFEQQARDAVGTEARRVLDERAQWWVQVANTAGGAR